jgi:glucosyl-3-phosphoglycerate phosphatase
MKLQLKNRYFAMRHGRSLANEQGIIVSWPENGVLPEYGLSERGRSQVEAAVNDCGLSHNVLIYSSDFSRACQTAEIVRKRLGARPVTKTKLLRERNFGDWEKTPQRNYEKVWRLDNSHAQQYIGGVEAPSSVLLRLQRLLLNIEKEYSDKDILLVSHGDTLQILQAGLSEFDPSLHREMPHIDTAEIRRLV